MSRFSKVAWKEGLFIKPQHLQQADRYMERTVIARTAHMSPFPWGIAELSFDQGQLRQGRLELEQVSGIMPDVAQTLARLGVELGGVRTVRSLKEGLAVSLMHLRAHQGPAAAP